MTQALIAADLTPEVADALRSRFGWTLIWVSEIRSGLPLGDPTLDLGAIEALVVEAQPVTAEVLAALPSLKVLGCLRGEPVNVDLEAATRRGVPVVHTPARNRESVADYVLGLMLSVTRNIAVTHHLIVSRILTESPETVARRPPRKDVIWRSADTSRPIPYDVFRGPELESLTLGLVGFGANGRRVGEKALALGMTVVAHDPGVEAREVADVGVQPLGLEDLLAVSDIVSLHARTVGPPIISARQIAAMKPGSYLINTGRANLVDYPALTDALRDGHLAGAGLDVFPDEPLGSDSPLLELSNVTLTPHLAGASTNVVQHQSSIFLEALSALENGSDAARRRAVRNPEVLEFVR